MAKEALTDAKVRNLKPVYPKAHAQAGEPLAKGDRYAVMDAQVPGFGVRVSDTGRRTFVLRTRFPGGQHASWRAIGEYPVLTLESAREKAGAWRILVKQGQDPAELEERQRLEAERRRENTFSAVAEDFIAKKLPGERKGDEVARDVRNNFIPVWGTLPVTEITDDMVASVITKKAGGNVGKKIKPAPGQARNLLTTAKRLFQWAVDQRAYGLKLSPAALLKPKAIVGKKKRRERVLGTEEVFAFWRATARMPYPFGPLYRLLLLTGLRLNEVADANWREFDSKEEIWILPSTRMKGEDGEAREHVVPVTDDIYAILKSLPEFKSGKFLFSTDFGKKPVWASDKVKRRLDARMLLTLRALARSRGDDPKSVSLKPWVNHDLRRTLRTGLSKLRIDRDVREAVLAHALPGIEGTYDRYDYLDEKRDALERWAGLVWSIAEPAAAPVAPSNVVPLKLVNS